MVAHPLQLHPGLVAYLGNTPDNTTFQSRDHDSWLCHHKLRTQRIVLFCVEMLRCGLERHPWGRRLTHLHAGQDSSVCVGLIAVRAGKELKRLASVTFDYNQLIVLAFVPFCVRVLLRWDYLDDSGWFAKCFQYIQGPYKPITNCRHVLTVLGSTSLQHDANLT